MESGKMIGRMEKARLSLKMGHKNKAYGRMMNWLSGLIEQIDFIKYKITYKIT